MNLSNFEYLNLNALRKYPLRDGVVTTDTTGFFTIPDNFIVDLQLAVNSTAATRFLISEIYWNSLQFIISIADSAGNSVGSFTVPILGFTTNTVYSLTTVPGVYQNASGRITIGYVSTIIQQPTGTFTFNLGATEIIAKAIIISPQAVNSITFNDVNGNSQTLTGNVNLTVRNNLRFSVDASTGNIIFDAGDGLGLNTQCTAPVCVQTINGVTPDPTTGNISFIGIGCSAITSNAQYTIQIDDQCCTPCAGCDALSTLTQRLNQLELSFQNFKSQVQTFGLQLTNFTTTANTSCTCPS